MPEPHQSPIGIKVVSGCPRPGTPEKFRGERQPNSWLKAQKKHRFIVMSNFVFAGVMVLIS
jgi:hypothetical protein